MVIKKVDMKVSLGMERVETVKTLFKISSVIKYVFKIIHRIFLLLRIVLVLRK